MKRVVLTVLYTTLVGVVVFSCSNDLEPKVGDRNSSKMVVGDPVSQDLGEAAKTVASVLGEMYQDPSVFALVNEAIATEHYTDDRMLLKDLLHPENSAVFGKTTANARQGAYAFRDKFRAILQAKRERMGSNTRLKAYDEDYFISNGLTIYFPYSRWFKGKQLPSITVVAAPEVDANMAPGVEYASCSNDVCSKNVMADEKYIQTHPTHVVQAGGAEVATYKLSTVPPETSGIRKKSGFLKVFVGLVRCIKQYDAAFSLTGNGGGSEIKIARSSAYLRLDSDGQVTSAENVVSVNFPRDYISLGAPIYVVAEWDQDWEEGDKEQFFAIYEEDTKGTADYGGSIKTTLKTALGIPIEAEAHIKVSVSTQDEIIVQHGWQRAAFLAGNNSDHGWGTFKPNTGIFGTSEWAVYDGPYIGGGGANVSFVMPHNFY